MPLTNTHWGTYRVSTKDGHVRELTPFSEDQDPSPIGPSIAGLLDHPTRIMRPAIRKSWLENGPGSNTATRGQEPFVDVSWDEAERLVAAELERVRAAYGNSAIYAGSYGWASAGRFHHAQSQIHRFLNCIGGYTKSINTYSYAAAEVIVPHVLGDFVGLLPQHTSWPVMAQHCELFVAFGGLVLANGQMGNGGTGNHVQKAGFESAVKSGVKFVNVSPRRQDLDETASGRWLAIRPNSDTAMILALCHTLRHDGLADDTFLERYTVGYDRFGAYLDGEGDNLPKTPEWAAALTGIDAETIRDLAREMAASRTMISISWSLTRQQFGEQPYWAAIALAAMLGQIGTPGGGIGFGYAIANHVGNPVQHIPYAALPQGRNAVSDFIPVARITDLLLNPGQSFDYNGGTYTYPDTRLIYWAGGNPFHHHQDLNRMRQAWTRPETIIQQDWCWNTAAKYADIVLPCTTPLEREDIGMTPRDPYVIAMAKAAAAPGEARDDYDILCGIARHMGVLEAFSEGRTGVQWVRHLWDQSIKRAKAAGHHLPDYDSLTKAEFHRIDPPEGDQVMFQAFRQDPEAYPLRTPSGRIELFSQTVAGFGYDDCLGHATWNAPDEWLGSATDTYPLHMLGKQPSTKLHSQLDPGQHSQNAKIDGHEPVEMSRHDAESRGLSGGDIVRVFNDRGAALCGVIVSDSLMPGVVMVSTGAWFDLDDALDDVGLCKHGNPNVLSPDIPTSKLSQGPAAHSCLVQIERYQGPGVTITAHHPPDIIRRDGA